MSEYDDSESITQSTYQPINVPLNIIKVDRELASSGEMSKYNNIIGERGEDTAEKKMTMP